MLNTKRIILGKALPQRKKITIALTNVFGIGLISAKNLLKKVNINNNIRFNDLSKNHFIRLSNYIVYCKKFEGPLKRKIRNNLDRLLKIQSYRGLRHQKNLPSRGQRTRTNAKTQKREREKILNIGKLPKKKPWQKKKNRKK